MTFILFLYLLFPVNDDPKRTLTIPEQDIKVELLETGLKDDQTGGDFRKLLVKKDGQIVDQVLLMESNRADYGYQIFDHYCDDKTCLVVLGSYDQFYLYNLQSFEISKVIEICQEKYCDLIDAQSCAIFDIKIQEKGQKVSLDARDCKAIIFEVKDISFSNK